MYGYIGRDVLCKGVFVAHVVPDKVHISFREKPLSLALIHPDDLGVVGVDSVQLEEIEQEIA